jgi:hypothetical protein
MAAHIWLGLATVPLALFHSGWRFGGTLATVLMVLLIVVVVSGVFGLVMQQFIPNMMRLEVPSETVYSQIDRVIRFLRRDASHLIEASCGLDPCSFEDIIQESEDAYEQLRETHFVVGKQRAVGIVRGVVAGTQKRPTRLVETERLLEIFEKDIAPFLEPRPIRGMKLANAEAARQAFQEYRDRVGKAGEDVLNELEDLCDQRRQLARQSLLHVVLHAWLWVHWPLSVSLTILLIVHMYVAVKFW